MKSNIRELQTRPVLFTRAGVLKPFERLFKDIGAPYQKFLRHSGIPTDLIYDADAPVPLIPTYKFIESAASAEGEEHLALLASKYFNLEDLGHYGQSLSRSTTVYDYLNTGIKFYDQIVCGEKIWITKAHGKMHFCHSTPAGIPESQKQISLFCLGTIINTLRLVCGENWAPETIGLPTRVSQKLPFDFLANTRVVHSPGYSFFTFPEYFLTQAFRLPKTNRKMRWETHPEDPVEFETDFASSVSQLVGLLITDGYPDIHIVAEATGLSKRTLQRKLFEENTSYSRLVEEFRIGKACDWLERSDMPITLISQELAYRDATNFSRAFRRKTGQSPINYRRNFRSMS